MLNIITTHAVFMSSDTLKQYKKGQIHWAM